MKYTPKDKALLLLEDGTLYEGYSIGIKGTTTGELCFNTGMTGYQEIYTDPSYFGQIIVNTNSHIGNYGVLDTEQESGAPKFSGLVCKEYSSMFSRLSADGSLQNYFEKYNIVGISGVDTRQLVRHLREKGAMNGVISSAVLDVEELKNILAHVPSMVGLELSSKVTTNEAYTLGEETAKYKVAVLDLGVKRNILKNLVDRDCQLKVFPANTSYQDMLSFAPNGFFISNGPGDPEAVPYAIETVKTILDHDHPTFGICLGHQMISLANGVKTYKMHHGHRGLNHPVKNLITGKGEITSQNHGFAVRLEDVQNNDKVEVTHVNLNDGTVEGIRVVGKKAFSVQYHPESSPGPHDSTYLFDDFIALMQ